MVHEEEGGVSRQLDAIGEGLFVVDTGTIDLSSPGIATADDSPVIRLSEGDYCGEYATLFNVPFRIKAQFKSRWDRLLNAMVITNVTTHTHTHTQC